MTVSNPRAQCPTLAAFCDVTSSLHMPKATLVLSAEGVVRRKAHDPLHRLNPLVPRTWELASSSESESSAVWEATWSTFVVALFICGHQQQEQNVSDGEGSRKCWER